MSASFHAIIGRYGRPFWALCLFITLVFLLGGGSRANIESLVILRPVSAIMFGYGLWGLLAGRTERAPFLLALSLATVIISIAQLIPLPPVLWTVLPGRNLLLQIDRAAALGDVWRPLSLLPSATWNSLYALMAPIGVLLIGLRLNRHERSALLLLLIGLGSLSAVVAVFQIAGPVTGPFYLYRYTNYGSAVGLFANRNHQALLLACMVPMLAAWTARDHGVIADLRLRAAIAISIGVFLIPLILVTGSRAGLVALVMGLSSIPFLCTRNVPNGQDSPRLRSGFWMVAVPLLGFALVALTVMLGRADAIDRLLEQHMETDARIATLAPLISMVLTYFPAGSGFGSFPAVFLVAEPEQLLSLKTFGHAHNDLIELAITGGLPALLLLLTALVGFAHLVRQWFGTRMLAGDTHRLAGSGIWIVAMVLLASLVDYPLRVPSLACLAVVAILWARPGNYEAPGQKEL
ncbi:O-antigen ligase family protein [Sphingomonas sp. SRS2]|uniref:O-antigen ligase family protein n=1 Tax=Sphingomonas sp. SRS2 TaxID=133190 RepID=UPI000696C38C|nr:O-antigen ligase family protein [Sphingomonas sp. SRS2]